MSARNLVSVLRGSPSPAEKVSEFLSRTLPGPDGHKIKLADLLPPSVGVKLPEGLTEATANPYAAICAEARKLVAEAKAETVNPVSGFGCEPEYPVPFAPGQAFSTPPATTPLPVETDSSSEELFSNSAYVAGKQRVSGVTVARGEKRRRWTEEEKELALESQAMAMELGVPRRTLFRWRTEASESLAVTLGHGPPGGHEPLDPLGHEPLSEPSESLDHGPLSEPLCHELEEPIDVRAVLVSLGESEELLDELTGLARGAEEVEVEAKGSKEGTENGGTVPPSMVQECHP